MLVLLCDYAKEGWRSIFFTSNKQKSAQFLIHCISKTQSVLGIDCSLQFLYIYALTWWDTTTRYYIWQWKTCYPEIFFGIHLQSPGFAFLQENACKKYNQYERESISQCVWWGTWRGYRNSQVEIVYDQNRHAVVQVQSLPSTFDAAMCIFNAHLLTVSLLEKRNSCRSRSCGIGWTLKLANLTYWNV